MNIVSERASVCLLSIHMNNTSVMSQINRPLSRRHSISLSMCICVAHTHGEREQKRQRK